MRKPYLLISGAWLLHAVAWFLPVVDGGVTFPHGVPGWEAFGVAATAYQDSHTDSWYLAILSTISAATTPLLIFGSIAWDARSASCFCVDRNFRFHRQRVLVRC